MSTRAVYSFQDYESTYHVYKHWDGYPDAALKFIAAAQGLAWELPRYEAGDFAAAFVAANKKPGGGDVYLTRHWEAHGDLSYRYQVRLVNDRILVRIYQPDPENFYELTLLTETVDLADYLETVKLAA